LSKSTARRNMMLPPESHHITLRTTFAGGPERLSSPLSAEPCCGNPTGVEGGPGYFTVAGFQSYVKEALTQAGLSDWR